MDFGIVLLKLGPGAIPRSARSTREMRICEMFKQDVSVAEIRLETAKEADMVPF